MDMSLITGALGPAMARDNSSPDDRFTEDGLRICSVCGEKKQTWFEVKGLIARNKVPCMCKCERDKLEAEENERKREILRKRYLADEQYQNSTFALDDGANEKASAFCKAYVENWEWAQENNAGLMLWGDVGGGKTFLAACIANALIEKNVWVAMTTLRQLVAEMTNDFGAERERVLKLIFNVPFLILDDVGVERQTEYSQEQVYEIINARYKAKKPLIVTTNLAMETLKNAEDVTKKRIYDRLVEMCTPLKVTAQGRRQKAARDKMAMMMDRFGL